MSVFYMPKIELAAAPRRNAGELVVSRQGGATSLHY